MPSGVIDPPTPTPLAFDRLDCEAVPPGRGPLRWRLRGRAADGRRWLLHVDALPVEEAAVAGAEASRRAPLPAQLTRACLAADALRRWSIESDQGRFELGMVRVFAHEDVSALAAQAVPPRRVPFGKRVFWRAVFALLATRAGRRWLERRAAA